VPWPWRAVGTTTPLWQGQLAARYQTVHILCASTLCRKSCYSVAGLGQFRKLLETDVPYGGVQVINVSLGVGVPALLVCLFGDGNLRISQPETARCVQLQRPLSVVVTLLVFVASKLRCLIKLTPYLYLLTAWCC
jgi:hypothetical protein